MVATISLQETPQQRIDPLLRITHLTKRFPGVVAVDDVTLAIEPGEIVALLGQNGAGKSTLIQVVAGRYPHGTYQGEIELDNRPYRPRSIADAEAAGIALIPQELSVVPEMTVAQNIYLNHEPQRLGFLDRPALLAGAGKVLRDFGLDIDPNQRMGSLDLANQQMVVIARALSRNARLLILDEPTAALTDAEAQRLFEHMRALRQRGVSCIFVSHRLPEVFAIADRVLVMRDGALCSDTAIGQTTRDAIVADMIGASVMELKTRSLPGAEPALEVIALTAWEPGDRGRTRVYDISLTVHHGEIVGLFGLIGAGCTTVARALYGSWPGKIESVVRIDGEPVSIRTPGDALRHGIGLLEQDRRAALILDHAIEENIALASLDRLSTLGVIDRDERYLLAERYRRQLSIRTPSVKANVGTLSGGNQQKVQVSRWMAAGARILLLVDPTRGVDVGARAEICALWQVLAQEGRAILCVSSEAEELIAICHRILVMKNGRIVAEFAGDDVTESELLNAAAGE
jgi:ABC-type sugar transport system ATPase subunit